MMPTTMSVQHPGGGPPLPKRSTSQRQPRVTVNHAPLQKLRSNSTEAPPPLPPHHPETRRSNKSTSDAQAAPDLPSRIQEGRGPFIQRKAFETNSTRALPSLPNDHAGQTLKQSSRDRPLPPPPSPETVSTHSQKPSVSNNVSHGHGKSEQSLPNNFYTDTKHTPERKPSIPNKIVPKHESPSPPPPPPPSISKIPTGRRRSNPGNTTEQDDPLPPPPPEQTIPRSKPVLGKSKQTTAVDDRSESPPPPPPARRPTIKHKQISTENTVHVPPTRHGSSSASSSSSKHSVAVLHDFEKRFVFHEVSEFPDPEAFSNKTKDYPSQVLNKQQKKEVGSIGAL